MKAVWAAGFLGFALSGAVVFLPSAALANEPAAVKIRDLTSVEGVRETP